VTGAAVTALSVVIVLDSVTKAANAFRDATTNR